MKTFNSLTLIFLFVITANYGVQLIAKKRYITIEKVETMCRSIHTQITSGQDSQAWYPECIIGISRGGLIPTGFLAGEALFNNRNVKIIALASYTNECKQSQLECVFPLSDVELENLKKFKSILIVDDIADSGKTLAFVIDMFKNMVPDADIKTATLFYKKTSTIQPDYYVEETDCWIVFPWDG